MNSQENPKEPYFKINAISVALFFLKFILVCIFVFSALYILNEKMDNFITEERTAERVKEAERRALERAKDDCVRANEWYDIIDHYDGQFIEIFEKRVNADYIFIGTSHITHGVTPEPFEASGKKFFNFALNGSNPSYYQWWYNDVFKPNRYVKPKAIIFGVDWFMFDTNWLWRRPEFDYRYLRDYSNPPPDLDEDDDWEYESETNALRYTGKWYDVYAITDYITNRYPLFTARRRFIELIFPEKKEEVIDNNIDENDGEQEIINFGRPTEPIITQEGNRLDLFYKGFVPWEANFSGHNAGTVRTTAFQVEKDAFVALVEQFQAEGIPIVFVMAPEYLPGRNAPQFDELTDEIALVASLKGIPFLNYNRELVSEINGDYTNYSDWGHLNNKGAQAFSKMLYDDLKPILGID